MRPLRRISRYRYVSILALCVGLSSRGLGEDLVVIGDSLSDPGNLYALSGFPPSPPYDGGRFSNGPVWIEQVAEHLGLGPADVANLARGGATTGRININPIEGAGGMLDQLDALLASDVSIDDETLVVVWGGANDLGIALLDPATAPAIIEAAVGNIAAIVSTVVASGARRVVVPNVPDLGLIPQLIEAGPEAAAGATALTAAFNAALADASAALEAGLGVEILPVDTFGVMRAIVADPVAYGFETVDARCLSADLTSICASPETSLFWDRAHPTTAGHAVIASEVLSLLLPRFVRGDCDGSGAAGDGAGDAVELLLSLFSRRLAPPCVAACDANGDGRAGLGDAIRMLHLAFWGGFEPPAPYPGCGPGLLPGDVETGCETPPSTCDA